MEAPCKPKSDGSVIPPADEQLRRECREDVDWNAECFTSVLRIWSVLEKLNETVMKGSSTVTIPNNSGKKGGFGTPC